MTKRLTLSAKTVPPEADRWVKQGDNHEGVDGTPKGDRYTARLTLDITPELRKKIKLRAFASDKTVADMLREILEREFAKREESAP
jgi:hypothetical protein